VKVSFAREPLSFQRNPPPDDDFGLRGGERERLLFLGGEGGMFAMSLWRERRKERLVLELGRQRERAWRGRVMLRHATLLRAKHHCRLYIATFFLKLYKLGFGLFNRSPAS
jgi:hypothetical protein